MSQDDRRRRSLSQSQPAAIFASLTRKPRPQQDAKEVQEAQQAAFKTSKRYVLEQVRSDWFYEPYSPGPSTPTLRSDLHLDVSRWTAREQEDTSGSEAEKERQQRLGNGAAAATAESSRGPFFRSKNSDSVVEQSMLQRKRKRRRVLEEEMQWNEGLRNWVARRDAWTGARPPPSAPHSNSKELPPQSVVASKEAAPADGNVSNRDVQMVDAESRDQSACLGGPSTITGDVGQNDGKPAISQTKPANDAPTSTDQPLEQFEETLVPVVESDRLFGNNARPTIKPSTYPAIYSRLIIQSNSPAVPINLKHVTRALVHGWKANGEWPPKPTPRNDVPTHRKQRASSAAVEAPTVGQPEGHGEADANEKAKRRSGSFGGAVKKVFNLTSGRRMHFRSNSRDTEEQLKEHTAPVPP